jgi:hypothetical protein
MKGRLQNILRQMLIADVPAAQAEQHRPMTVDDGPECEFVAGFDKSIKQLPVAEARKWLGKNLLEHRR